MLLPKEYNKRQTFLLGFEVLTNPLRIYYRELGQILEICYVQSPTKNEPCFIQRFKLKDNGLYELDCGFIMNEQYIYENVHTRIGIEDIYKMEE